MWAAGKRCGFSNEKVRGPIMNTGPLGFGKMPHDFRFTMAKRFSTGRQQGPARQTEESQKGLVTPNPLVRCPDGSLTAQGK